MFIWFNVRECLGNAEILRPPDPGRHLHALQHTTGETCESEVFFLGSNRRMKSTVTQLANDTTLPRLPSRLLLIRRIAVFAFSHPASSGRPLNIDCNMKRFISFRRCEISVLPPRFHARSRCRHEGTSKQQEEMSIRILGLPTTASSSQSSGAEILSLGQEDKTISPM